MIEKSTLITFSSLDIETISEAEDYNFGFRDERSGSLKPNTNEDRHYSEDFTIAWRAEFGKIVCISVGYTQSKGISGTFRSLPFGEEKKILNDFNNLLNASINTTCADIMPKNLIFRLLQRMIINQIVIQ
jgi:hypothetical protein